VLDGETHSRMPVERWRSDREGGILGQAADCFLTRVRWENAHERDGSPALVQA
jgi:hypothetical protein